MSDPSAISNLLSYLPSRSPEQPIESDSSRPTTELSVWRAFWSVLAVHATELEREGVIDESGFATIARALDTVLLHKPATNASLPTLYMEMEQRIDALLPPEFAGVTTLGLAREDWQATAVRLLWVDATGNTVGEFERLRRELVSIAEAHAMSLMPAMIAGRPAQPTMLGHFLGGVISPLRSASVRLDLALAGLARSPLGAGLMSGEMIAVDRERAAKALGFSAPIGNTFDAVANVEDFVVMIDALSAGLAPLGRIIRELASWIRTSPNSLVLAEQWEAKPEPTVPSLTLSIPLMSLIDRIEETQRQLATAVHRLRASDYAPLGHLQGVLATYAAALLPRSGSLFAEVRDFWANGLMINRAYLGNRAGRGYTTAGDLASFLMTEEQLPPAAARGIASIVAAQLTEQSLETNSVTQEMIDSAALMLIGREVKVEIETLGRYLAPRRFIERRQVTGSPAAEQLRAWLASERHALIDTPRSSTIQNALDLIQSDIARAASEDHG
jgi:argininosuccinate lyase